MATLVYQGPYRAVDVPSIGVTATEGEPVEIPDDTAESLMRQGWTEVTAEENEDAN